MRLAHVRRSELAAPVVALECDGALYEVATLEEAWRTPSPLGSDFFCRVIAARCAGLAELEARLLSGTRPTEARLFDAECLPLPPCAPERSAYWQLGACPRESPPRFSLRDARALAGDGQPVLVSGHAGAARFDVGFAALLGDELAGASAGDARRAVVGLTLLIDWGAECDDVDCSEGPGAHLHGLAAGALAPAHVGARLVTGSAAHALGDLDLSVRVGDALFRCGAGRYDGHGIYDRLARLSDHATLAPGDLVGLGPLPGARFGQRSDRPVAFGVSVTVSLGRELRLAGSAIPDRRPRRLRAP
ncbi:MAG: hypothetical protein EXR75_02245 [Myxococcales bacterium]|nr:hypothetical protein [Myxococcales bacterium]